VKVQVEGVYKSAGFWYRLTLPSGSRAYVKGDTWTRKLASTALDEVTRITGVKRSAVRFEH
jgi:hypothetical protein